MVNIQRFEAIEITVPASSTLTRYYFPDLPNLRSAQVTSIELYTSDSLSSSPLTGSALISDSDLKKSFLTLYQGDLQLVYNIPLVRLNQIVAGSAQYVYDLPNVRNMVVSWVKSYVVMNSAPTSQSYQQVFAFGVYYNFGEQNMTYNNLQSQAQPNM